MNIEPVLTRITELIVRACAPRRILLFGSHAKGMAGPDSDIDLLVIGDFRESRFLRGREVRELLSRFAIGIDVLFMTEDEVAVERLQPHGFVSSILERALVIYSLSSGSSN